MYRCANCFTISCCPSHRHSLCRLHSRCITSSRVSVLSTSKSYHRCPPPRAAGGDVIDVGLEGIKSSLTTAVPEDLAPNREGYRSIELDTCEFLIATTADGKLDLRDAYVYDKETGIYANPEVFGDLPSESHYYQTVPWKVEFLGDAVYYKPPWVKIVKWFLVQIRNKEPYNLELENIFELDDETRQLRRAMVERVAKKCEREVLRIRNDGKFIIVPEQDCPTPDEIIEAHEEGLEAPDITAQDEFEELEDELDQIDVPAVDLA